MVWGIDMNKTTFMSTICFLLIGIGIHFESSKVLFVAIGFGLGNLIMGIMNFFEKNT